MRRWVWLLLIFFVLFALLIDAEPIVVAFHLLLGWALFLYRAVGQMQVNWPGVLTAVLALAAFVAGAHYFLRWLYAARQALATGESNEPPQAIPQPWRFRWTAQGTTIVLMLFVAGISMIGITHQTVWMFSGKEPMFSNSMHQARSVQSRNELHQMGEALARSYIDHKSLPAGCITDSRGQSLHGWQTALLPYLDERELYQKIDMSQPWDSPRNRAYFAKPLNQFLNPSVRDTSTVPAELAPSHFAGNVYMLGGTTPHPYPKSSTDTDSKTIMAGEAAGNFSPWGKPGNWREPTGPLNRSPDGFGGNRPNSTNFLMTDGSVQSLTDDVDPEVLRALSGAPRQDGDTQTQQR